MVRVLSIGCACVIASCRALPPAPPAPADADAAPVCLLAATECACARLCELACEECDPACVAVLDTIIADRVIAIDVECIAAASNKPAARACGGIRCAD